MHDFPTSSAGSRRSYRPGSGSVVRRLDTRSRLDRTWVTAKGEIIPFQFIKNDHLLNIGRRLERDSKKRYDERIAKLQEAMKSARMSKEEREETEARIEEWKSLNTIERTVEAFPKYQSLRQEAYERGILEEDKTFAYAIDRSKPRRGRGRRRRR